LVINYNICIRNLKVGHSKLLNITAKLNSLNSLLTKLSFSLSFIILVFGRLLIIFSRNDCDKKLELKVKMRFNIYFPGQVYLKIYLKIL